MFPCFKSFSLTTASIVKMEGLPLLLYSWRFLSVVFATFMSFLAPSFSACPEVFQCGNQSFGYPFGAKNSGCGDPALRLDCDHQLNMPLVNISGYQYYVVKHFRHWKEDPAYPIRIVDRNMWGDACNPSSSNRSMELWSGNQFSISDEYMNISLWGECREDIRQYLPSATEVYALECNNSWYYSEMNLGAYCKSSVQLPVEKFDRSNRPMFGSIYYGFRIKWSFSEGCEHCESKKELCIFDTSNSTQLSCKTWSPGGSEFANKTAIALGSSLGGVALMAALAVLCIWYVKRRKRHHTRGLGGDYSNYQKNGMEAGYRMIGNLTIFPYEELQQATIFFDERNILGGGGFGVVYLGKLHDGRSIAVKKLHQDNSGSVEKFMNEVHILSSLCHPSLVRLYGCTSPQSPMLLLVYEFVPNGTLSDHLHGSRRTLTGLPWATRVNIAIESAWALAYLHSMNPPIFHRDVKSTNILLDEHFRAKVADFGLSRLVPLNVSHVTTAPQGTPGYVDPEYHQCFQLTEKSDVYSLGVVLVEIISAKVAVDVMRNRNEISLANMATDKIRRGELDELVDPDLKIERNHEVKMSVAAFAELAFECLAIERDFRPTMKEVVARLTEIKEMLQESTESSNSISTTPTSSLTSPQENWLGIASD